MSPTTRIKVWELCIDGISVLEDFVQMIENEGSCENDLVRALRNLELAADLVRLPNTKFREIKGQNLNVKIYEAKNGVVRIYHFQEKYTGRIIVLGGYKSDQALDIKAAIKTIKDYQNERK